MADKLKYKKKKPFLMISHDFIKCEFLDWNEKNIYTILLMYADNDCKCFPSIKTLSKLSGKSNKTIIKTLKQLEEKKLLKKESRITKNGQSSNLYTLYNFDDVWEAENIKQAKEIVNIETKRKQLYELAQELNYVVVAKEEEPASAPAKVTETSPKNTNTHYNSSLSTQESQEPSPKLEEYPMEQIHRLYDYDTFIQDNPYQTEEINAVMGVLHTTLNTDKPTIKVCGQDKPASAVKSRLMKLTPEMLLYALCKFAEQASKIKNPSSYMLSILYKTPEDFVLHISNTYSINENNQIKKRE